MRKVKWVSPRPEYYCITLIALDHGLSVTGWANMMYLRFRDNLTILYTIGNVRVKGKRHSDRIYHLYEQLIKIGELQYFRPTIGVTENVFVNRNWKTTNVLNYAKAICLMYLRNVLWIAEIYNTDVKRRLTGYTWYSKQTLTATIAYQVGRSLVHSDGIDALGLGLTYLYNSNLLSDTQSVTYLYLPVET